jgi:uncharacterized peroxidase-related enzyme
MKTLEVLNRDQVSEDNQGIFDALKGKIGMVPNLYATVANSNVALGAILNFGESLGAGEFSAKEVEAIALAVGQVNGCEYCLAAHTAISKMSGFSEEETLDLRAGNISDTKLAALTQLAIALAENKGRAEEKFIENFFAAGYTQAALVELIGFVALNTFTNFVNNTANTKVDFPAAPELLATV